MTWDNGDLCIADLGVGEEGGDEEADGKANLCLAEEASADESTKSGMPGDVLTLSVTTSSGSKINTSSWEISVT